MSSYPLIAVQKLTGNYVSAPLPLGTRVQDAAGNVYECYRAGEAVTAKNFLTPDVAEGPHDMEETDAAGEPIAGCAMGTLTDNYFGFMCINGTVLLANVADAVSAGETLGTTTTAGQLAAITAATPTAAEVVAAIGAATGRGVQAMTDGITGDTATVRIS